jgi:hypothetical protein
MKKPKRQNISFKKKTGWNLHPAEHMDETFLQIDVAPLITGITDCLHVFYPQLQKSFTVSMDRLTESDIERFEAKRQVSPVNVEEETLLSDDRTRCYLIREEPVGDSYAGIMRYVVREAHKHQASQSMHLLIQASVDALFEEESNIETVGVMYPELGVEFTIMPTESDGADPEAILDELINVMLVSGWDDGEDGASAPHGYRFADDEEEDDQAQQEE